MGGQLGRDQELTPTELFDFLGPAYLKYSFTRGTEQEAAFIVESAGLRSGHRVLDVGCGPGRHAAVLTAQGIDVTGVDLSEKFVKLGTANVPAAGFIRADARHLPVATGFDAVISLCQGAFGLVGDDDGRVLREMARAVHPGGAVVFSAFSAYFAVRFLEQSDRFDAGSGMNHERTTVRNDAGDEREFDLWTSCFTPRELRLLCERAGLVVEDVWSVTPGAYARNPPDLEHPEFLVLARKRR